MTIKVIFKSKFNYNADKKNISSAIFPKLCIQVDIHLISHLKVKQVGVSLRLIFHKKYEKIKYFHKSY